MNGLQMSKIWLVIAIRCKVFAKNTGRCLSTWLERYWWRTYVSSACWAYHSLAMRLFPQYLSGTVTPMHICPRCLSGNVTSMHISPRCLSGTVTPMRLFPRCLSGTVTPMYLSPWCLWYRAGCMLCVYGHLNEYTWLQTHCQDEVIKSNITHR